MRADRRVACEVHGSVGVAVGLVTATAAVKRTFGQRELLFEEVARTAATRARKETVCDRDRSSEPRGFVREHAGKHRPRAVGQRARQPRPHQSRRAQIFEDQVTVGLGQSARFPVHEVFPHERDARVHLRKARACALAIA